MTRVLSSGFIVSIALLMVLCSACSTMNKKHQSFLKTYQVASSKPQLQGTIEKIILKDDIRFIKIKNDEGTHWVALLSGDFKVGDMTNIYVHIEYTNHYIKTLDKRFKRIIFGSI